MIAIDPCWGTLGKSNLSSCQFYRTWH